MTRFDDILPEIGDRGPYQVLLLIVLSFVKFFAAFQTVAVVFTAGRMDFQCAESGNESSSSWQQQVASNWTEPAVDRCYRLNGSEACNVWVFNSTSGPFESSWRSQFSLVCSREKLVNLCSTLYMLGLLIGSTGYGALSDHWGRLRAACAATINVWVAGIALAFSPSVEVYAALRFLCGLGSSGILSVCNAMMAESVTQRYRLTAVLLGTNGWNIALCVCSIIAFGIRSHWKLELTLAGPAILSIPLLLLLGESPRWLLAKNRPDDANRVCQRIARINCRRPPACFDEDVRRVCRTLIDQQGSHPNAGLIDLLRSPTMRIPTLLLWNNFFASSMVYYGLILSTGTLSGNIYLTFLLGSAVGVPASAFSIITAHIIGRPLLFSLVYFLSSACMFTIAFLLGNPEFGTLVVALAITGRFFSTASFDTSWAYSGELFPTLVRNVGMGSSSTAARVGGILAPLINILGEVWKPLPFIIFASVSLLTAFLALLLPETKGAHLPESLKDADKEYVKPKVQRLFEGNRGGLSDARGMQVEVKM
ncbi:hypothetical protein BOX15_Mlig025194g2 [Macrostomum lignano]|uniref:Major facilitator superfamily (MFS) profile domain-containing protein n=1 Tax=Macrostomum lignano TaxID=282301 RepID=A0A267FJC9_9PLAT|nr:hypothetical protein BOX15_Mlig025194g2 [Macrostomum lignano]